MTQEQIIAKLEEHEKRILALEGVSEEETQEDTQENTLQKVFSYPFNTSKVDTNLFDVHNRDREINFDEVTNIGLKVTADGTNSITDQFANRVQSKAGFLGNTIAVFDFEMTEITRVMHCVGLYIDDNNYATFSRVNASGEEDRIRLDISGSKQNTDYKHNDFKTLAIAVDDSTVTFLGSRTSQAYGSGEGFEVLGSFNVALSGTKHFIAAMANSTAGRKQYIISNLEVYAEGKSVDDPVQQVHGFTLKNYSYSWWCAPISVYDKTDGCNYFTTVDDNGDQVIHKYNNATDELSTSVINSGLSQDEHNTSAFLLRGDEILTAFNGHNIDNFWIRKFDRNLKPLDAKVDIAKTSGFNDASYAQLYEANGKIFLLCRNAWQTWKICWSEDGGNTWSKAKTFIKRDSGAKLYANGKLQGDTISFAIYSHPVDVDTNNRIYTLDLDTLTGRVSQAGRTKGYLFSDSWQVIDITTLDHIYDSGGGRVRLLDVSVSDTHYQILIATFGDDYKSGYYKLLEVYRDTLKVTTTTITTHGVDTYKSYFGGAYFVQDEQSNWNGTVYLSRENAGIWTAEEWWLNDVWTKVREIDRLSAGSAGLSITRPKPPINSMHGGIQVVYQKGDYDNSYRTWRNELIGKV